MSVTERTWRSCKEIPVAEIEAAAREATTGKSRSEGAQKASATRAKNTARGISRRGIVATLVFMAVAVVTTFISRHVVGL